MSEPATPDPGGHGESSREFTGQMRPLLMAWDPIGVADIPSAADEYDCMIPPLLHRLSEGADARSLATWISHERSSHFSLDPDEAGDMRLAVSLAAWWEGQRNEAT
jgi:hypothetical protein